MVCGDSRSDSAVKPRMSESQIAARIASVSPRRIWPAADALAGVVADIGIEQRRRGAR